MEVDDTISSRAAAYPVLLFAGKQDIYFMVG
jgi:hypothetical protein